MVEKLSLKHDACFYLHSSQFTTPLLLPNLSPTHDFYNSLALSMTNIIITFREKTLCRLEAYNLVSKEAAAVPTQL